MALENFLKGYPSVAFTNLELKKKLYLFTTKVYKDYNFWLNLKKNFLWINFLRNFRKNVINYFKNEF